MTFPGPRLHADDQRPCSQGLRCMALFGSTVKCALNIRIGGVHRRRTKLLRCWTRDWRAPSLPQVGIITVLNCVMAGAPASASRTPL